MPVASPYPSGTVSILSETARCKSPLIFDWRRFLQCGLVLVAMASLPLCMGDEPVDADAQVMQWNVFLKDWQLLGPFPKPPPHDSSNSGLDTPFVADEAVLQAGRIAFFHDELFVWRNAPARYIEFRSRLNASGPRANNAVAYAFTTFDSQIATTARLSIGVDDTVQAWLNGQPVLRGETWWAAQLDQLVEQVEIEKGLNTLLLKVGNGTHSWNAAARFLPAETKLPLLTFFVNPGNRPDRLPTVKIDFITNGTLTQTHHCSGLRDAGDRGGYYALYTDMPTPKPDQVTFSFAVDGIQPVRKTTTWDRAASGTFRLPIVAASETVFEFTDAATGQPINDVELWHNNRRLQVDNATAQGNNANGSQTIALNPMVIQCWAVTPGYEPQQVKLPWPRPAQIKTSLSPGGQSITGFVRDASGQPIADAEITSGLYGNYAPTAKTDEHGRFHFASIPSERDYIYPTIVCDGYVSKDRFRLDLANGVTEVNWTLNRGNIVQGRVVDKNTGQGISDVIVVAGNDRFGSNIRNPSTTTSADGSYRLSGIAPGPVVLHALCDHYAPAKDSLSVQPGRELSVDFTLVKGLPVTGVVTDDAGQPMSGVRLLSDTWNGSRMFERETKTDVDGTFVLPQMPESDVEINVLQQNYVSIRDLMVKGGEHHNVVMKPELTFVFRVQAAENASLIPELQILKGNLWDGNSQWHWSSHAYETIDLYNASTGILTLQLDEKINGKMAYRFRAPGFADETVEIPHDADEGQTFDVNLKPAEVLRGIVVDHDGSQLITRAAIAMLGGQGQVLSRFSEFRSPWRTLTDSNFTGVKANVEADGHFTVTAPDDLHRSHLIVGLEDGRFQVFGQLHQKQSEAAQSNAPMRLKMLRSGGITGRVMVAQDVIPNARVDVLWLADEGDTWPHFFRIGGEVLGDEDGVFTSPPLSPGRYEISRIQHFQLGANMSTSQQTETVIVEVAAGQVLSHDIIQAAGVTMKGRVLNADNTPSIQAIIGLMKAGQQVAAAQSDENGDFEFPHLQPDTYDAIASQYVNPDGSYSHKRSDPVRVKLTEPTDGVLIQFGQF